jgi:hypothetical protein
VEQPHQQRRAPAKHPLLRSDPECLGFFARASSRLWTFHQNKFLRRVLKGECLRVPRGTPLPHHLWNPCPAGVSQRGCVKILMSKNLDIKIFRTKDLGRHDSVSRDRHCLDHGYKSSMEAQG